MKEKSFYNVFVLFLIVCTRGGGAHENRCPLRLEEGIGSLKLELQTLLSPLKKWVLGTELGALNH